MRTCGVEEAGAAFTVMVDVTGSTRMVVVLGALILVEVVVDQRVVVFHCVRLLPVTVMVLVLVDP